MVITKNELQCDGSILKNEYNTSYRKKYSKKKKKCCKGQTSPLISAKEGIKGRDYFVSWNLCHWLNGEDWNLTYNSEKTNCIIF